MKNLLLLLIALLLVNISSLAQAPEKFKYQAIITDNKDHPVRNKTIGLEISILQSNLNGTIVYQETFTTRTSSAGLVNLEIGTGMITSGVFSDINWGVGPYYLGIGVDMNGSGNYISMGASQLLSVPYALYAKQAQSVEGDFDTDPTNEIELPEVDGSEGQFLTTNGEGLVSWQTPVETVHNLSAILSEGNDGDANQIKNIADPTEEQDAATKAYVDSLDGINNNGAYYYLDQDGDNSGNDIFLVWVPLGVTPPQKYADNSADCNDNDATIHPEAEEIYGDGLDNDCDGEIDEYLQPEIDYTGKWRLENFPTFPSCYGYLLDPSYFRIEQNGDLVTLYFPGIYQPLSGQVGNGYDMEVNNHSSSFPMKIRILGTFSDLEHFGGTISISSNCGINGTYGISAVRTDDVDQDGYSESEGDCNDNDETINPGATEICGDGIDNNCNGEVDEGCDLSINIISVSPTIYQGSGVVNFDDFVLTILGEGFLETPTISFRNVSTSTIIPIDNVTFVNGGMLTVTYPYPSLPEFEPLAVYDILVNNPDGTSGILLAAFTIGEPTP